MKTSIKKKLVVAFMLVTLIGYASNEVKSTNTVDTKRVKVEFMFVKKGHTLTIKDEQGTTIHSQKIKKSGDYSKIYDLNNLKDGKFTIELEKGFEIIEKPFIIEKGNVTFIKDDQKTIFKPVIRNKENLILISKLAFDKEPIEVILYYNHEVIYTEILEGEDLIEKAYRISDDKKGDYKVVVRNTGRSYFKNFSI